MVFIGIIPARFASTRFPGKPLAYINGKPMIQWVYENAQKALEQVWVATDDKRIFDSVNSFGGKTILTSVNHKSGTDRIAEAAKKLQEQINFDVVVNIQGDEPFVQPEQIETLTACFDDETEIATLVKPIQTEAELSDPNKPKVVIDKSGRALYFSRSPIPYLRNSDNKGWLGKSEYWAHVGMYAYKKDVLQELAKLSPGKLEEAESLEQLRWLENGYKIKTAKTNTQGFGIDTPEDLKRALQLFK